MAEVPTSSSARGVKSTISPDEAEAVLKRAATVAGANARRDASKPALAAEMDRMRIETDNNLRRQELAAERARLAERVARCAMRCNVPERYSQATLADFSKIPADCRERYTQAARKIAVLRDRPIIIALIGNIGTGKTFLACALINSMIREGRSAAYLTAMDYVLAVRQSYARNAKQTQEQIESSFIAPKLLALDEMQVRGETPNEDMLLLRLIDKRYQAGVATLLISNHETKAKLMERIDARIADRMADGGGVIVCDWDSLRGRI